MIWFAKIEDAETFAALPGAMRLMQESAESTDGCLAVQDILDLAQKGAIQLWAGGSTEVHGVLLSEISDYPRMRVLRLFGLAADDFRDFSANLPEVEAYGRANGCEKVVTADSRAGLAKLPGYKVTGVCLSKPLEMKRAAA